MTIDSTSGEQQPATDNARKAQLAQGVQQEVVQGGRVETQGDYNAVIRFGKPTNHVLHLILTVVTLGLWSMVWLVIFIINATSSKTITLNVDAYGNMLRQKV